MASDPEKMYYYIDTDFKKPRKEPINGCLVSPRLAVGLAFLAVLLAVGVGLIVFFAVSRECPTVMCVYSKPSDVEFWNNCQAEAKRRNELLPGCHGEDTPPEPTKQSSAESSTHPTNAVPPKPTINEEHRLPTSLFPVLYDLELKPNIYNDDPTEFNFEGSVAIYLNCTDETTNITLHSVGLTMDNDSLSLNAIGSENGLIPITSYSFDVEKQFLIFRLQKALQPNSQYILRVNFSGPIKTWPRGLFYASYQQGNDTHYVMASHLQRKFARRVFPCFDEPALRALFNVVIVRKRPFISLSNMPIIGNETRMDGFVADIYNTTVKMSTYIVSFALCDFPYRERVTRGGTIVRVWSRPEELDNMRFGGYIAKRALEYFEDYLDVPYSLPKLDVIVIPMRKFGMENWGLVTISENLLSYHPEVHSIEQKQMAARVMVHEIAHQWFGNLVTVSSWDDIWLSEGFARLMEYIGLAAILPDFLPFEQFVPLTLLKAMEVDAHPGVSPVHGSRNLAYDKGASILRMLRHLIGEDTFKQGMTRYLGRFAYEAVRPTDLYQALSEQIEAEGRYFDVEGFMTPWILQKNYPLVTVNQIGNSTVEVRQERFLLTEDNDSANDETPFGYKWDIPLTLATSTELDFNNNMTWLLPRTSETVPIQGRGMHIGTTHWIIANIRYYGYYRVNYDKTIWHALISQLNFNHQTIDVSNRAQLIADSWALYEASVLDLGTSLQTVEYLEHEMSYVPWSIAKKGVFTLEDKLSQSALYGDFMAFGRKLTTWLYMKLTDLHGLPDTKLLLRDLITELACKYDVPACVDYAKSQFGSWMSDNKKPVKAAMRPFIYCTSIRNSGSVAWNFLYDVYLGLGSGNPVEKKLILESLGCTPHAWILQRYMEKVMEDDTIPEEDVVHAFRAVQTNPGNSHLAWRFVRNHWDALTNRLHGKATRLVNSLAENFFTDFDLMEVQTFMANHTDIISKGTLENVRRNIGWFEKNEKIIADWLKHYHDR